jgi:hypothetical protein
MQKKKGLFAALSFGCLAASVATAHPSADNDAGLPQKVDIKAIATQDAIKKWHDNVVQQGQPTQGCFRISYPSAIWTKIDCDDESQDQSTPGSKSHDKKKPMLRFSFGARGAAINGHFYFAHSFGTIKSATGSWKNVVRLTDVSSSDFADVPQSHNDEYSFQMNTNLDRPSDAVCAANKQLSGCVIWQQFLYASTANHFHKVPALVIQTWVFPSDPMELTTDEKKQAYIDAIAKMKCPDGITWQQHFGGKKADGSYDTSGGCYNSIVNFDVPWIEAKNMAKVQLQGRTSENPDGTLEDTALLTYTDADGKTTIYTVSEPDPLDFAHNWHAVDFNIVGNGEDSNVYFNGGTEFDGHISIVDDSDKKPECRGGPKSSLIFEGISGEGGNYWLDACGAGAGDDYSEPGIHFHAGVFLFTADKLTSTIGDMQDIYCKAFPYEAPADRCLQRAIDHWNETH